MDRHDPHRVVVVLGQDRVGDAALRRLQSRPRQVAAHPVPADIAPRPGLVDHVPHAPPHIVGIGTVERDVEQAPFVDDRGQQVGGRPPRDSSPRSSGRGRWLRQRDGRRATRVVVPRRSISRRQSPIRTARRRCSRRAGCATPPRAPARRWDRRRLATPASGGGSRAWCTRPSCSRPGTGRHAREGPPRVPAATCVPGAGR